MNFQAWVSAMYAGVQDILSPAFCAHCWVLLEQRTPLCTTCVSLLRSIVSFRLVLNAHYSCVVHALSVYEEPLKSLIRAKQGRSCIGAYQLGVLMTEKLTPSLLTPQDIVVPVPLHWQRYAWRGFNQAHIIADLIARAHGAQVVPLVVRTKQTAYQAEAGSREDRQLNVQDAFVWNERYNPQDYATKRLVFIDDLMTTGATLRMMTQAVCKVYAQRKLTPPQIIACVAARVTR